MKKPKDLITPAKVADFLLLECRERGELLTNLKLQKLLYYAQAWYLALKNKPLFQEDFQAWIHGPALPSQYRRFKEFGWGQILKNIRPVKTIDKSVAAHLHEVVDVFGVETAVSLEIMTHNELPWKAARKEIPIDQSSNEVISKESMRLFYQKMKNEKS
jgi:uncharacterized phage-associated protein